MTRIKFPQRPAQVTGRPARHRQTTKNKSLTKSKHREKTPITSKQIKPFLRTMSHSTMRDYKMDYKETQNHSPRDYVQQPIKRRNPTLVYVIGVIVGVLVIGAIVIGAVVGSGSLKTESSSKEQESGNVNENVSTDAPTPADVRNPSPTICSFDAAEPFDVRGDGTLLMKNYINVVDKTVSVQLDYLDEAWIGFAFTEEAVMVPNIAIIGLPDLNAVEKYSLTLRDLAGVAPLEEARQTLLDGSIVQTEGRTNLEFTKLLSEDDEVEIKTNAANRFNWAIGSGNDLAKHLERGSILLTFNTCNQKEGSPVAPPVANDGKEDPPVAPPVANDKNASYAPTYAPTVYNDKKTYAPIPYGAATDSPSYSPTWAPIKYSTEAPTYAPTYKPTDAPIYKATNAPTYYEPKTGSWSKRGNRRSCAISACPSAPWTGGEYTAKGDKCENGLDASYWNGTAIYYEYYTEFAYAPTTWEGVWKMEADYKELPIGWGGDFASGSECYDDPLRGGYRVDLTGTDWWFDSQAYTIVKGFSPAMKMIADGKEVGEWNKYGEEGSWKMFIPDGAKVVEVYCGGWPATCTSQLYVKKVKPPTAAPVAQYIPGY